MNCDAFEKLIALYVEGDLREADRPRVELHLAACRPCRALLEDLEESLALLAGLRHQVPNSSELLHARQRVLEEVVGLEPSGPWMLWMDRLVFAGLRHKTALAGMLLCFLGGGALWFAGKAQAPVAAPQTANTLPAAVVSPSPVPTRPAPIARSTRIAPPKRHVPLETAPLPDTLPGSVPPKEDLAVRFLTDDPNVIIYWLISEQGE